MSRRGDENRSTGLEQALGLLVVLSLSMCMCGSLLLLTVVIRVVQLRGLYLVLTYIGGISAGVAAPLIAVSISGFRVCERAYLAPLVFTAAYAVTSAAAVLCGLAYLVPALWYPCAGMILLLLYLLSSRSGALRVSRDAGAAILATTPAVFSALSIDEGAGLATALALALLLCSGAAMYAVLGPGRS